MRNRIIRPAAAPLFLALTALAAAGCDRSQEPEATPGDAGAISRAEQGGAAEEAALRGSVGAREATDQAAPGATEVVVYKSPTCGCCNGWIEHMEANGFTVRAVDVPMYDQLVAQKREAGVPEDLDACHTAMVGGYVVEGHVPAEAVRRLLAEHPDVRGVAVPGMPTGSPGMEGPNPEPYDVIVFDGEGEQHVWERVDPR